MVEGVRGIEGSRWVEARLGAGKGKEPFFGVFFVDFVGNFCVIVTL